MPHETIVQPIDVHHVCDVCTFTEPFDYAFIVLKAYDARWGAGPIKPYLKPDGLMVAIQNGMTAEDIAEIAGPGRSMGCVLEISAGLYEPGTVIRDSPPDRSWFAVGSLDDGTRGREQEVADLLRHAGTCEVMENILSAKWMKLVSNRTTIVTTSLLGLNLKEGEEQPGMREFMLRAGQEAADIGEALGHERLPILNGLVADRAAESDLDAPASRAIIELARRVEARGLQPESANLEFLLEIEARYRAG